MKIITTIGTSIFENYKQKNKNAKEVIEIYNGLREKPHDFSTLLGDDDELDEDVKNLKDNTYNWAKNSNNASAEIASILAIAGNETDVKVHLIATDTVLSVLAAELIECWFNQNKPKITVGFSRPEKLETQEDSKHIIHQLRVSSNKDFQEGFMNLIDVVSGLIDDGKRGKEEVVLNITGGYKAIIPIMTLVGQIKEVPLKYIYEESSFEEKDGLVEVGNLPISFDWGIIDALKPFLNVNYSPFWDEDNKKITKALSDGHIYLDIQSNNFREDNEKAEFKDFLNKKDLRIIKSLLDLKLITSDIKVTALGRLLQKVQELDRRRGYQMEYILYNYFAKPKKKKAEEVSNYSSTTLLELSGAFNIVNNEVITRDTGAANGKDGWREIGDIDISLKNGKTFVLGESKALNKFITYSKDKNNLKYKQQILARLQRFIELNEDRLDRTNPSLEFLVIIFQFQFKGFEEKILNNETVREVIMKFKELENQEIGTKNLTLKPRINFLGLKCLLGLNHKNISANYTSFYQKPTFKWEILNEA